MVINTNKLNLEEQEKLAAVGHFWKNWGSKLLGLTIVALLTVAAVFGYNWYQVQQSGKAMALYNQVLLDARAADADKLASSLKAMQDNHPGAIPTQQAELLAARVFYEKGQADKSRSTLAAAAARSNDKGLQSIARLQLASLLIEQQQYDEAIKQLSGSIAPAYAALAADRMGDAYALQDKRQEAIDAYTKAFNTMEATQPYRQMIASKLLGFGVDVASLASPATSTANSASTAKPESATEKTSATPSATTPASASAAASAPATSVPAASSAPSSSASAAQ